MSFVSASFQRQRSAEEGQLRWRQAAVAWFLFAATALIIVNQRIGFDDTGGINRVAMVMRSDIWFAIALVTALALAPQTALPPVGRPRISRTVLFTIPICFLLATLLATLISAVRFDKAFDPFGAFDFLKALLCLGIGAMVFNLSKQSPTFSTRLIGILMFASVANVLAAVFTSATSINNIEGFNPESAGDVEVGLGFVGYGERFQGLGSNPNIVMTQAMVALSFLVPVILHRAGRRGFRRVLLTCYALSLLFIIAWTGVRAALLLLPLICIVVAWLRTRASLKSQLKAVMTVLQMSIFLAGAWVIASALGVTETLVDRVTGADDGRLNIWTHYIGLLFENPLGLGIAFESITDTYSIVELQRLPPHNSVLQIGMYGGFFCVGLLFFLLGKIVRFFVRQRRFARSGRWSLELQGVFIAWCVVVVNSLFGGLLSTDFTFTILTALLMALIHRSWNEERTSTQRSKAGVGVGLDGQ
jgi:hypothetical protein